MSGSKKYLVVVDFLSQKFEVEYEENMLAQDVIRKVQQYLFPSERSEDLIQKQNEESHRTLNLYRKETSKSKGFHGATLVTWNIRPEECEFRKYQFFLFRPSVNILLPIYMVFPEKPEKRNYVAFLKFIYPIKKKAIVLKNYLKEKVIEYTKDKEAFKDHPVNGFKLEFIDDSSELLDEEYTEQWMNGKEMLFIVYSENNINQNSCSLGRFYYYSYGQVNQVRTSLSKDGESLDYDERNGITLSGAKKKLIEKHQNGNNYPEEKVVVLFNGIVQTYKFKRMDDLFSDNDFYQFVVIFESDINKHISQVSQSSTDRTYDMAVHESSRPNIVSFEIVGEPKRELRNRSYENNSQTFESSINDLSSSNNSFINELNSTDSINNSINYSPESNMENINYLDDDNYTNNDEIDNTNDDSLFNDNNNSNDNSISNDNDSNNNANDDNNNNSNDNNNSDDNSNTSLNTSSITTINDDNDNHIQNTNDINGEIITNRYDQELNKNTKEENNDANIEEEEEDLENDKPKTKNDDYMLDMFCYYFLKFSQENQSLLKKTPNPTYFNNLTSEEMNLVKTFKKYYNLYRQSNH